jgi:signal peptidase I
MEPTLLDGDRVRVDLKAYADGRTPAVGDVVLVRLAGSTPGLYIKRVVAVAGESIALRGSAVQRQGRVVALEPARAAAPTTDGRRVFRENLDEHPHLVSLGATDAALIDWPAGPGRQSVPAGHVFLLGDARDNSIDSRQWGPVPLSAVQGRVVGIIASAGAEGLRWDRLLTEVP